MQRRSCKRRLEHEGIQEKRIGWEAWTRTRIARSRVWSPTNWTTSHPWGSLQCARSNAWKEQKEIAAGSRGSGQPRFYLSNLIGIAHAVNRAFGRANFK